MIVIDASAIIGFILHEENWEEILNYIKSRKPLYSLDLIMKEASSAIWKHTILRGIIPIDFAKELYERLEKLIITKVIILENELTYLKKALEIALRNNITIYDALYISQAEKYGELLTLDIKQAEVAKKLGIKTYNFS